MIKLHASFTVEQLYVTNEAKVCILPNATFGPLAESKYHSPECHACRSYYSALSFFIGYQADMAHEWAEYSSNCEPHLSHVLFSDQYAPQKPS